MKRVLCIVGSMDAGGAETFLMKVYRNLDRTQYQMDFCVAVETPGFYDEEIKELGGKIHHTTPKSQGILKSFTTIKQIVKENNYKYVIRVSQHSLSSLELLAAKLGGAEVVAFRSSNSKTIGGKMGQLLHKLFMPLAKAVPNVKIAPSTEAAEFMFGKGCVQSKNVYLLHNGLDTEAYKFDEEARNRLRKELNLVDKLVVGHVGRFNHQKNHDFLIDVFSEIKKKRKDAILVLVGKGELEEIIRNKVNQLGLSDSVHFLGVRSDVPQMLSVMDIFVFPSFFEGMPNTVIEAQTSGLPCVVSNTITSEAEITNIVKYMDLEVNATQWAEETLNLCDEKKNRLDYYTEIKQAGYDIHDCAIDFVNCIFGKE